MLFALIRPREIRTVEVIGTTLEDVQTQLAAHRQPGFDLADAPVRMLKGEAKMEAVGMFLRVDGIREIDANEMPALKEKVPDGWRMLSVRRA
ncbi:hypothetical protein [Microbacterium foliorum]|uniref:hypothetical protein n=1 Tax=Microbacterium foliorum TaxID=104336 RepID=UPI001D787656|nr:hypothetical protein [Microbacterium foliorum]CAH0138219.1 hypothetical protein SRABI03_00447 [Microbacterium foliorum]CAH0208794.1 hypothetical protein SRABI44_02116 [Microbacterium foliorum]